MIGIEDAAFTYEYNGYYKILPVINNWSDDEMRIKDGKKVKENFTYDSAANESWMTIEELHRWLQANSHKIGKF